MKKTKKNIRFMKKQYLILLIVLIFSKCATKINEDNTKPIIKELKILDSDKGFNINSNINIFASFIDDYELGYYKIDIHFAGDGHRHYTALEEGENAVLVVEDRKIVSGELKGLEQSVNIQQAVVSSAKAGPYHCLAYLTDEAGNVADFKEVDFLVNRDDMPVFEVTNPDFDTLKVPVNTSFAIGGKVTSVRGLSRVQVIVRMKGRKDDIVSRAENKDGENEFSFSENINIPNNAEVGKYQLFLLAADKSGNVGYKMETFEVVQK